MYCFFFDRLFKRGKRIFPDKSQWWIIQKSDTDGWIDLYHEVQKDNRHEIVYLGKFAKWETMYDFILRLRVNDIDKAINQAGEFAHIRLFDRDLFEDGTDASFSIIYKWPYAISPYLVQSGYRFKEKDFTHIQYRYVSGTYCIDNVCKDAWEYIITGKDSWGTIE